MTKTKPKLYQFTNRLVERQTPHISFLDCKHVKKNPAAFSVTINQVCFSYRCKPDQLLDQKSSKMFTQKGTIDKNVLGMENRQKALFMVLL